MEPAPALTGLVGPLCSLPLLPLLSPGLSQVVSLPGPEGWLRKGAHTQSLGDRCNGQGCIVSLLALAKRSTVNSIRDAYLSSD